MTAFLVGARALVIMGAFATINSQALAQTSAGIPASVLPDSTSAKPAATVTATASSTGLSSGSPAVSPVNPAVLPGATGSGATAASAANGSNAVEPPAKGKATVYGVVKDDALRKPLANARVVLQHKDAEHKRFHVDTGKDGSFSFKDIDPGNWSITFSHNDMLSQTEELVVAADQSKAVNIVLEDIEPVDVMRVTGKRTLIHPEKIGSSTTIPRRVLEEYRSGNDLRQLVESTPGVITDTYGNIITRGEHNAINYELDGVVLPEAAGVLQQSQPATPRSLQSMQVDIGGYEAHDGGGPLGAVVRMKSRNIEAKPKVLVGGQIGGPMAGNIYYDTTGAFSANPQSKLHRLRWESSGQFIGSSYRLVPYTKKYSYNQGMDINTLSKLEYKPNERDTFRLTAGLNQSFMRVPLPQLSASVGVKQKQTDMQNFIIAAFRRTGGRFYDEANIALTNAFYRETFASRGTVFDPLPVVNGEEPQINSVQPTAKRFNYVFSAQGNLKKQVKTHHLETGFYSEIRPVSTAYGAIYRNSNLVASADSQGALPYGAIINPFTFEVGGPNITGGITKYKGFRYLQSGWFQDSWKPKEGFLKRLTVNAGVRADVYSGVFGNTMKVAQTMLTVPGVEPFDLNPFKRQTVTDAQASGRFGASFVITPNAVLRGSFSNIFTPPPVDVFVTAPLIADGQTNGIYNGTIRPLRATRGNLVDVSLENQFGPRLVTRTNLYYKKLNNFGDSGVIQNTPLYNRLQLSAQESYGVETRLELKPARDGYGFNGFVSNTVQVAYLRGTGGVTGGIYEAIEGPREKYPDHDRRYSLTAAYGYRSRRGWWVLADVQTLSGLPNRLAEEIFGPQPKRTPRITLLGLSSGYNTPKKLRVNRLIPSSFDVRIDNILNERKPTNLGSPFQGTRFLLPFRLLCGASWQV
ncbi:MAG: TonB-dependent receptor [Candidatus Melainabacteria bacterium]|nr:TonB-dependent receptor [Candidatus Melainabacteria bacterium]